MHDSAQPVQEACASHEEGGWIALPRSIAAAHAVHCCKTCSGSTRAVLPLCASELPAQVAGVSTCAPEAPGYLAEAGKVVAGVICGFVDQTGSGSGAGGGGSWRQQQPMLTSYLSFPGLTPLLRGSLDVHQLNRWSGPERTHWQSGGLWEVSRLVMDRIGPSSWHSNTEVISYSAGFPSEIKGNILTQGSSTLRHLPFHWILLKRHHSQMLFCTVWETMSLCCTLIFMSQEPNLLVGSQGTGSCYIQGE